MKKKILIGIIALIIVITGCITLIVINNNEKELLSIKSQKQLKKIYEEDYYYEDSFLTKLFTLPFSYWARNTYYGTKYGYRVYEGAYSIAESTKSVNTADTVNSKESLASKDYSKTNIQVENVDEADITKTDGDYIYSLSENNVMITDVRDINNIKISAKITPNAIPEDLILYNDKLVVIEAKEDSNWYYNSNTLVEIYDISNKEQPRVLKKFELFEPYFTTRCIDGKLYVISSGELREEENEILTCYKEDSRTVEMNLKDIKYLKDIKTSNQTLFAMLDLNNLENKLKVSSYLMDISNAYISEENIYLSDYSYNSNEDVSVLSLFGWKGIFGAFDDYDYDYGYKTNIYKFNIQKDGSIKYVAKAQTDGEPINQFSFDEYNKKLRVALYDYKGSRVEIYDEKMDKIGETEKLAKGERMYSSRFIGDKAYLVTYKNTDPLFVIDMKDPTDPYVQGELKIPGYSTYLHPYDETHLIGIGMQTKETINRNQYTGKVVSTSAVITGMKMALFDVSDVNNPKQISEVTIGDSRTSSAILTNHKALLFSNKKKLLAIPVNNYETDINISVNTDNTTSLINAYNGKTDYVSEGYLVYNINLNDGIKFKGSITHENTAKENKTYYYYNSRLLRGLYIDDNLYTVSEDMLKINKLSDLQEIGKIYFIEPVEEKIKSDNFNPWIYGEISN